MAASLVDGAGSAVPSVSLSNDSRIYYASYGSNILVRRLMAYITGGVLEGLTHVHKGCDDVAPPRRSRMAQCSLPLQFAQHSGRWGGGVAFVDARAAETAAASSLLRPVDTDAHWDGCSTLLRLHDVSLGQFMGIALQENGDLCSETLTVPTLARLASCGAGAAACVSDAWYGCVVHLGDVDGMPAFTFTARPECFHAADGSFPRVPPSAKYAAVIADGLCEAGFARVEAEAYVRHFTELSQPHTTGREQSSS